MPTSLSSVTAVAENFFELLRTIASNPYVESVQKAQLIDIWVFNPSIRPLVSSKLAQLAPTAENTAIVEHFAQYIASMAEPSKHPLPLNQNLSIYSLSIAQAYSAMYRGQEQQFINAIETAILQPGRTKERWPLLKCLIFCLNRLGHHTRAQACSMSGYELAQQNENTVFQQRTRFSVLHSIRLEGNADISVEYMREYKALCKGKLRYELANCSLVPSYAAQHLIQKRDDTHTIKQLLGLSDELVPYKYAKTHNRIAWANFHLYQGQSTKASKILHELIETVTFDIIDIPTQRELRRLASNLNNHSTLPKMQTITKASPSAWRALDTTLIKYLDFSSKE